LAATDTCLHLFLVVESSDDLGLKHVFEQPLYSTITALRGLPSPDDGKVGAWPPTLDRLRPYSTCVFTQYIRIHPAASDLTLYCYWEIKRDSLHPLCCPTAPQDLACVLLANGDAVLLSCRDGCSFSPVFKTDPWQPLHEPPGISGAFHDSRCFLAAASDGSGFAIGSLGGSVEIVAVARDGSGRVACRSCRRPPHQGFLATLISLEFAGGHGDQGFHIYIK
jgi:hypothetical protein